MKTSTTLTNLLILISLVCSPLQAEWFTYPFESGRVSFRIQHSDTNQLMGLLGTMVPEVRYTIVGERLVAEGEPQSLRQAYELLRELDRPAEAQRTFKATMLQITEDAYQKLVPGASRARSSSPRFINLKQSWRTDATLLGSLRFSIRREGSGLATFRDCAHRDDGSWSPIGYTLILTTEERKTKIELRVQTLSQKTRNRYVDHKYEHEVRNFEEPLLITNLPPVFTQTTLKTCDGQTLFIQPPPDGYRRVIVIEPSL